MRIHELSKELGIESKVIIKYLQSIGVDVKSSVNVVDDTATGKVRKKFANNAAAASISTVKAVAVPGGIVRAAAMPKSVSPVIKKETEEEKTPEKQADETEKIPRKKKITTVFNPQYSETETGKAIARQQKQSKASASQKNAPEAKKPIDPSKLPSRLRPAKDRIPDDELAEMAAKAEEKAAAEETSRKEEKTPAAETAPAAEKTPVAEASQKKEKTPAAETAPSAEKAAAEENAPAAAPASAPKKSQPKAKNKKTESSKNASDKQESEAIRSLREKLVKGSVRISDIQVGRGQKSGGKDSSQGNRGTQRSGAKAGQGQRRDISGTSAQGSYSGRSKGAPGAGSSAPVQDGRGRKGRNQRGGKSDKFDKFDRLENENAVAKSAKNAKKKAEEEEIKVITLPENISIKDLASKMKVQPSALIKQLFLQGQVYTLNDIIDFDTAEAIALESEIICEHEIVVDRIAELLKEEPDPEDTLVKRPPVVCVMGHVDHGKTSLLDAIRKTNVTSKEAGGITQAIGAYTVEINGEKITFLDTPGHEAFTAMRMRGAKSTDVAILVVAADDGVMPQTIEAINHAKAAEIHVIVAVNKIDKPGANIDRVKQELSNQGLTPEDWGGNTIFVPISAKTGENIEQLLEMVILDTEILELRANPDRKARGVVIEAKLDKGRGTVATLLVQKGTLKVGDHIAMGESYGKVRAMTNDKGMKVKEALPSTPVEITGLSAVPKAGDTFVAFDTDKEAKEFASVYIEENRKKLLAGTKSKMSLDDVFDQMKAGELKNLDIILKADVQGSVEALKDSLEKLSNDEVVVRIIHSGVGNVNESDAILASASNAIIIAFNVQPDAVAKDTIEHEKVDLRKYNVIYNAIDDVELAMKGMLEPIYEEAVIGHVDVRQTFKASGVGVIAGSYVTDGIVKRDSKVRLSRGEDQLFDGKIASLKRFQDDAKEVKSGFECGIVLDGFSDIKEGDTMEVYEMREVPRE